MFLLFPLLAQAATVGKFTSVEGDVDVTAPGQQAVPARLGDPVNVGDIIRTKSKSKCEVTFLDGSVLRLAETSRLRVAEFSQEREQRSATLNLFRGKIQNIVKTAAGAAGERSKYEVQMPTAVTGVRGTNFFAFFQAGVSGAVFKEGTGYGYSLNRPQEVRSITVGQAMLVTSPDLPPTVRAASSLELNQHERDTTPSEKPKEEGRKEEDKKPETVTAKAEEGKKEEEQKAPAKAEEKLDESKPTETKVAEKAQEPTQAAVTQREETTIAAFAITSSLPITTGDTSIATILTADLTKSAADLTRPSTELTRPSTTVPAQQSLTQSTTLVPVENITPKPPVVKFVQKPPVITSSTSATITVAPTESTVTIATYSYTLKLTNPDGTTNLTEGTDPDGEIILANLPEGRYDLEIAGKDVKGNVSEIPLTASWTVDTMPPVIALSGKPASLTNTSSLNIGVSSNEQATYTYTHNDMPVDSPYLTDLSEGEHTLTVTAVDLAGNTSTESYSWTVDYSTSLGGGTPVLSDIQVGGQIDAQTNQGTVTIAAAVPGGLPEGASGGTTSGVVGDNPYSGFLTLVSGSWEGLLNGIYVTVTGAGYITGDLSGTDSTGSTSLSGSGPVRRSGILGLTDVAPGDLTTNLIQLGSVGGEGGTTGFPLPILGSITVGGAIGLPTDAIGLPADAKGELRGIDVAHPDTGRDRMLGVWGVTTSGGAYSNPNLSGTWTSIYGEQGSISVHGSSTPYFILGQLSGTDDGNGHVSITGDHLTYMETGYIGDISLAYRGKYDPAKTTDNYDSAGAGTFTLDPLAYSGSVYGQLEYYGESNGVGNFSQGGWVDYGLLGGTGDLFNGSATWARLIATYTPYEGFYSEPALLYGYSPNLFGRTGMLTPEDRGDDGAFNGYLVGIWNNGSLAPAKALTLAVKPTGDGYEAGVIWGDLTGSYYPDLKMWEATGNLIYTSPDATTHNTAVTPDNLASSLNYGELSGSLAGGNVAGAMRSNYSQGNLLNISDQAWGIWNMSLGGSYTGTPSGTAPSSMGGSIYGYGGMDLTAAATGWLRPTLRGTAVPWAPL